MKKKIIFVRQKKCNYGQFQKCEKFIFTPKGSKL